MPPKDIERAHNYDDSFDDAKAAFEEVMGTAKEAAPTETIVETPEPEAKETTTEEPRDDGRDDKGRFAPAKRAGDGDKEAGDQKVAQSVRKADEGKQGEKAAGAEPAAQVAGGPPPSFSVKSKAAWDQLPDHIRADIVKREGEMQQGLAALRDYKDLKPYAELAQRHNTTIPAYLERTLRMEGLLRQSLPQGLAAIAQNFGLSQPQAAALFSQMARAYGGAGAAPAAGQAPGQAQDPLLAALQPALAPLMQQIQQLQGHIAGRAEADRNAQAQSLGTAIQTFAADPANRYYAELEETMARLFEGGMVRRTGNDAVDIKTAYDMAANLHPEVREALIEQRLQASQAQQRKAEQDAVAKARNASRSLTGSRMPGATTKEADAPAGADDVEADVMRAFRQHAGA